MASNSDKFLGEPGLAKLIDLVRSLVSSVQSSLQASIDDLEDQIEQAGSGVTADETTITKSDSGVLSAKTDVEGGVTSLAKHNADIVVDDGSTTSKSGNAISVRAGGIQPSHLSNGCVTTDKIASSAVTSDKLADGSVTNAKIAGPVSIANGGTGSVTAEGARESLGVVTKLESITLTDEWQDVCGYQLRLPEFDGSTVATSVTINVLTISGLSFIRSIKADTAGSQKTETTIIEQLNGEPYGMVGDGSGYPAFDDEGSVFCFSSRGTTSIGDDHIYRYWISRKGDSYVSGLREFNFFNFLISPSS